MDLPVELVGLLKHIGIDGKKLTWDLQVNSSAVSVKLMWIKAAKPVEKTGEITNRVQKKMQLSPSTRRRNTQHMDQWKAKREAVGDNITCVQTQTDDLYPSTDETTQTEQLNSDAQSINIPTVLTKKRERSTQTRCTYTGGMQPT
jgi:response regulator of citrate/malate metabolism